jgi:hypothetical protein
VARWLWETLYHTNKTPHGKIRMMRILKQKEIEGIVSRGRKAPEHEITAILDELEIKHPAVYRVIYGEPSDAIAASNKDMANLYLDLSCDVVMLFREAFGKIPVITNEEQWVLKKLSLIDAELKSLTNEIPMDDKFRTNLQERFVKTSLESKIQIELLRYLENEVMKYASFNKKRATASHFTNSLLFVLVRLMGELYMVKAE